AALPGLCRFVLSADASALVPASQRCRAERLVPRRLAEELVGDEPLDIEVDLVLDKKVFCTLRSSKAIFDAPRQGDFRSQQFIFAIKVRDLPRDSHFAFRLRPPSAPRCCSVLALFNDRGVLRQGPAMDPTDHGAGKERDAAAEGRRLVALLPDDEVSDSRKLPDHGTGLLTEGQDASKFAGFRRASSARSATGRLQRGACASTAL
ncbi:unnamed protein product, partial [Symbiodinium necroappetens]